MKGRHAAAVMALAALLSPSVAAAQGPPTLTGEVLTAHDSEPPVADEGAVEVSGECAEGSTLTVTATGPAAGPYPGTFTERATLALGSAKGSFSFDVEAFRAEFNIDSAVGQVRGTKSAGFIEEGVAFCGTHPVSGGEQRFFAESPLGVAYDATIVTGSGTFRDRGTSGVYAYDFDTPFFDGDLFNESFISELAEAEPVAPTSDEQCKKGGWKNYPHLGFRNQGDCVSFIRTTRRRT